MKAFYGPYVFRADQPQQSDFNWPLLAVLAGLATFWGSIAWMALR